MRELNEYHVETSNKVEYNQEPPGITRRLENTTGGNTTVQSANRTVSFSVFSFITRSPSYNLLRSLSPRFQSNRVEPKYPRTLA